jgi:hypothetical protein
MIREQSEMDCKSKVTYVAPVLCDFGSVRTLTLSGAGSMLEGTLNPAGMCPNGQNDPMFQNCR